MSAAPLAATLPATMAWLAAAKEQLLAVEAALRQQRGAAAASPLPAASAPISQLPAAVMRTGLGASAAISMNPHALSPAPAAQLVAPVEARSWRGVVRCGLAVSIAGEVPLARVSTGSSAQSKLCSLRSYGECPMPNDTVAAGWTLISAFGPEIPQQ